MRLNPARGCSLLAAFPLAPAPHIQCGLAVMAANGKRLWCGLGASVSLPVLLQQRLCLPEREAAAARWGNDGLLVLVPLGWDTAQRAQRDGN